MINFIRKKNIKIKKEIIINKFCQKKNDKSVIELL